MRYKYNSVAFHPFRIYALFHIRCTRDIPTCTRLYRSRTRMRIIICTFIHTYCTHAHMHTRSRAVMILYVLHIKRRARARPEIRSTGIIRVYNTARSNTILDDDDDDDVRPPRESPTGPADTRLIYRGVPYFNNLSCARAGEMRGQDRRSHSDYN